MKKRIAFIMMSLLTMTLSACGGATPSSSKASTSRPPVKTVKDLSISLGNTGDKAYITVTGTQQNYNEGEFTWAWGLKDTNGGFDDGKESPALTDYQPVEFDSSKHFTVKYCLTDITTLKPGKLYRIYGGTPETYADIPFASNMFGANDATRKYYLRKDQDNALTIESIQPVSFTMASIVEVTQADLPTGVTEAGAYLKFGGANSKNLTMETINGWDEAGNIAGYFQRVIPSWQEHTHVKEERFWTIEGSNVFFYLYVGFIGEEEGWQTHFDLVTGDKQAGLKTETTFWGETAYTIQGVTYRIYSDSSKGTEEEYWGCLGVYREAAAA